MKKLESLLGQIRPDVTDALDVTTQLETLGYNHQRVQQHFELRNTFELGRQLFKIIPKRGFFPSPQTRPWPWAAYLLVVVGIGLALSISLGSWIKLMTLFIWSFVFCSLLNQNRNLPKKNQRRLFSLALIVGLGLIILGYVLWPGNPTFNARLLFWWLLNLRLWHQPSPTWHLAPLLLLGALSFLWPAGSIGMILVLSLLFWPNLTWPKSSTWYYLRPQLKSLGLHFIYAVAQALLISYLVYSTATPWLGLGIIGTIILTSEWLERTFTGTMQRLLWSSKTREDYHAQLFSSLSVWIQVFLVLVFLVSLVSLRLFNLTDLSFIHFALLGLATGLSLFLFKLKRHLLVTSGVSLAAGLAWLGLPFWIVMFGLIIIFLTGMMLFIMRVERSGLAIL